MPETPDLPEVRFAEHPERSCREPVTEDGLIDHWCSLAELHPGPHCPKTLQAAIDRRLAWEKANPGWERMARGADPFADFTKIKETPDDPAAAAATAAPGPDGEQDGRPARDGKAGAAGRSR